MSVFDGPRGRFAVCVDFSGTRAILVVQGALDRLTAPKFRSVAVATVDGGHTRVALDLAECHFIDANGSRAVGDTAQHLHLWGGRRLTISSPSSTVHRALTVNGLDQSIDIEVPKPFKFDLGDGWLSSSASSGPADTG